MLYSQIELPLFGIAVMANVILLIIVWRRAPINLSRHFFSLFVFVQILWIITNFSAFLVQDVNFLFFARLTMFFASFHAYFFFLFLYTFLEKRKNISKRIIISLFGFAVVVAGLTFSPWMFTGLRRNPNGLLTPQPGFAIPLFGIFIFLCVFGAFLTLVKKYGKSKGIERVQWRYLAVGLCLTFFLILIFSFLNFILLKDLSTVRFGHLYTLPFVVLTTYAIIKYHLFNIKVIATQVLVALIWIVLFSRIFIASTLIDRIIDIIIFVATLVFGFLLIKSVIKEVHQREILEKLTIDLEHANRRLTDLIKLKSEFLSIASHQLRTPTSIAKGMLSMVLDGTVKGKQREDFINKSFKGVIRLERIIRDLLNASELEGEKMKLECKPVDIMPIIKEVIQERGHAAEKKGLKLMFKEPKEKCPFVMVDQVKIVEVIANLIDNATQYTEKGSITIWCSTTDDGKMLELHVKDTGIGISKDDRKKLFKKFSRGERSPGINPNGSGLGLFIVKKIAEGCGGSIVAKSAGVNKGSEFVVLLRVA